MNKNAIVLWFLGGAGVYLLYCAVKDVSPSSLITSYFTKQPTKTLSKGTPRTSAVTTTASTATVSGSGGNLIVNSDGSTAPLPSVYTANTFTGSLV